MSPFLVTNPADNVKKYEVEMDGVIVAKEHPPQSDGSLKFDIGPLVLPDGTHMAKVRAGNMWGWSTQAQLPFDKDEPDAPMGFRISE